LLLSKYKVKNWWERSCWGTMVFGPPCFGKIFGENPKHYKY